MRSHLLVQILLECEFSLLCLILSVCELSLEGEQGGLSRLEGILLGLQQGTVLWHVHVLHLHKEVVHLLEVRIVLLGLHLILESLDILLEFLDLILNDSDLLAFLVLQVGHPGHQL